MFVVTMKAINNVFEPVSLQGYEIDHGNYRTAEECFRGSNFRTMMYQILKYLLDTCYSYPFNEHSANKVQEIVFNFALPPGQDICGGNPGVQFAQITFSPTRKLIKFSDSNLYDLEENQQATANKTRTFSNLNDVIS